MEEKYENKLYGKIEFFHERAKQSQNILATFSEIISKFINAISEFSKALDNTKYRKSKIIEERDSTMYNLVHAFKLNLKTHIDEFKECSENLNVTLLGPFIKTKDEKYTKEKELYNNYNKIKNMFNNTKNILEKSRKEFENNAKICEKNILNLIQLKSNDISSTIDITKIEERMKLSIINTKNLEDKYYQCLEEANKARENEIKKQKELLNFYQIIDIDFYSKINRMISFVVPMVKKMYTTILKSLERLEIHCKNVKIKQDINSFIEKNKSDLLPESQFKFIPYYPEATLELSNSSGNDRKNFDNLNINYKVLSILHNNFRDIRKDLNMEEEGKKFRLRFLCDKIFKIGPGIDFKKEEKNELLTLLKEKKFKNYFLITLSKQRTKGRYQRSQELLKDLSELLNFILDVAEKENDYDAAKNCIILSQTFYYEKQNDKKKIKKYLFDYIKNNEWLKSLDFWEGLTEFMIQSEIIKNEEIDKKNNYKENPQQMKFRMNNITFSQVLSNSNSMIEFKFDKDDIKKYVEIFVKKYDIEKSIVDVIYDNINNTPYAENEDDEEEDIKEDKNTNKSEEKEENNNIDTKNNKDEERNENTEEREQIKKKEENKDEEKNLNENNNKQEDAKVESNNKEGDKENINDEKKEQEI